MPFLGQTPGSKLNTNVMLDAITTSATATYALTKDSAAYTPSSAQTLLVSLNGVTQAPTAAYTISGSNIVFASALTSNDVIDYIIVFEGDVTSLDVSNISAGDIATSMLADDAVTAVKIADDAVVTAAIADDAITSALIADDAITSALIADDAVVTAAIADDAVVTASIADDAITSALIADDAVVQAAIADDAVDEARLQISNAGSNGQVLSKESGNTGGLTWITSGGLYATWAVKTAHYTVQASGEQIICNHASTGINITLPAGATGYTVVIKNVGAALVTVIRNGSEKINSVDANATMPTGNAAQLVWTGDAAIGWAVL